MADKGKLTAKECVTVIKAALKKFGEYNYYDKGAGEVIAMDPLLNRMRAMSSSEVTDLLKEVLTYKHGEEFVRYCVLSMDDREDFDDIVASPSLGIYY